MMTHRPRPPKFSPKGSLRLEKRLKRLTDPNLTAATAAIPKVGGSKRNFLSPPAAGYPNMDVLGSSTCTAKAKAERQMAVVGFDSYAWRVRNALDRVLAAKYPAGMIQLLEGAYPRLFAMITERLPADLDHLWRMEAPFEKFEQALNRWLELLREAHGLYQADPLMGQLRKSLGEEDGSSNGK